MEQIWKVIHKRLSITALFGDAKSPDCIKVAGCTPGRAALSLAVSLVSFTYLRSRPVHNILTGYAVNIAEKLSFKNCQFPSKSFYLLLFLTVFGKNGDDFIIVFKTRARNELFVKNIRLFRFIKSYFDSISILHNHRAGSIRLCRNLNTNKWNLLTLYVYY